MDTQATRTGLGDSIGHLLSLGLTQLSIQVTLSTSLTASALGLAALATALTSTILTVQGAIAPHWQWTLLPSIAATVAGYTRVTVSDSTTHTQATVHQTVGADESKALGRGAVDKQRIVPGGIPVVPKWLMKLLHLA
jgi:hypothetical protein